MPRTGCSTEATGIIRPRLTGVNQSHDQLRFLQDLVKTNASIAGEVVQVREDLWAIHGFIPVDGDVLMAEFDSYDQATITLRLLPPANTTAR